MNRDQDTASPGDGDTLRSPGSDDAREDTTAILPSGDEEGKAAIAASAGAATPAGAETRSGDGRPGAFRLVAAAVVGGLVGAAVLGASLWSGLLPAPSDGQGEAALARTTIIEERLTSLEARLSEASDADAPLADRLAAMEAAATDDRARIEALEAARTAAGESAATIGAGNVGDAITGIDARLGRLEQTVADAGESAETDSLGDRIDGIGAAVARLTDRLDAVEARLSSEAEERRSARAVAVGTVRDAARRGGGFAEALAMLQGGGDDSEIVAQLQPLAAEGAPSLQSLQANFGPVADAVLRAAAEEEQGGFMDRIATFGRGLVTVTPTEPIAGSTPQAIVSRMSAAVEDGDLATALDEWRSLPENARAASAEWASSASDRMTIDRLVDDLVRAETQPAG